MGKQPKTKILLQNGVSDAQASAHSDDIAENSIADQTLEEKNDAEATTGPAVPDDRNTIAASTSSPQSADIPNGKPEFVQNQDSIDVSI